MIDWWDVGTNGLWILGLSILLAAFSYHSWLASETGQNRRDLFRRRSFELPAVSGTFLAALGCGLGYAHRWWEQAFWGLLVAVSGWQVLSLVVSAYDRSKKGPNYEQPGGNA